MPLSFQCPYCHQKFSNIKTSFLGKRIRCDCGQTIRLGRQQSGSDSFEIVSGISDAGDAGDSSETFVLGLEHQVGAPQNLGQRPRRDNLSPHEDQNDRNERIEMIYGTVQKTPQRAPEINTINPVTPKDEYVYIKTSFIPNLQANQHPGKISGLPAQENLNRGVRRPPRITQSGPVLTMIACCLGFAQSIVLSVAAMAFTSSLLGSIQTAASMGLPVNVTQFLGIRAVVFGVLCLASIAFAIFCALGIFSSAQEMSESRVHRPEGAFQAGFAAGLYCIILLLCGCIAAYAISPPEMEVAIGSNTAILDDTIGVAGLFFCSIVIPFFIISVALARLSER